MCDGEIKISSKLFDVLYFFKLVFLLTNNGGDVLNSAKKNKILSIDYGTSKMGVAISDEECKIAFPKCVLIGDWRKIDNVVKKIGDLIEENNIKGIVFGFPKTLDNYLHKNCLIILRIVETLKKKYNLPVLLFDERFSTKMANYETKFDKKNMTKYDDSKSATIILNNVINYFNKINKNQKDGLM